MPNLNNNSGGVKFITLDNLEHYNDYVYPEEMTWDEYQEITPEEGKTYFITDYDEEQMDASAIVYDNTDSGLIANDVQDAVDELKDLIDQGGGGGTTNYNDLSNKPQISGTTLTGNKSASDLGLVAAENGKGLSTNDFTDVYKTAIGDNTTAINSIKDGTNIDSFSDVETTLATKADLTDLAPAFSTSTAYTVGQYVSYDGNIYKCTSAHSAGAWVAGDFTLVAVGSELESKQNASGNSALTTTDKTIVGAINEVNSNLSGKQNATDNNLQTTDKTIVGGINELKSGLIDVDNATVLNTQDLTTPSRTKNVLPMTLSEMKVVNNTGLWNDNVYTRNGVDFTVNVDTDGNVVSIIANGTSSDATYFYLTGNLNYLGTFNSKYTVNGGADGGSNDKYALQVYADTTGGILVNCFDSRDVIITRTGYTDIPIKTAVIVIRSGITIENLVFKPMIRLTSIADTTFTPYINSVNSRLESVESGLTNLVLKASSRATGTRREKLNDLYDAFNALSEKEKLNSYIQLGTRSVTYIKYNTDRYYNSNPFYNTQSQAIASVELFIDQTTSVFGIINYGQTIDFTDRSTEQQADVVYHLYTQF